MKNLRLGGKLFFLNRGEHLKQVEFWADFAGDPLVTVEQAWEQFGRQLGAGSRDEWIELVNRLPAIREKGQLRVIRGENAFIPRSPIRLNDAGVREVQHAAKGWSIGAQEVDKILRHAGAAPAIDVEPPSPDRVRTTVSRIIRDTQLAEHVKRCHDFRCQICGHTVLLADGSGYAEGHHVQPLGSPHNGPDVMGNIICLCPNHHAACDFGAIPLSVAELRHADGHVVDPQYIAYHNRVVYRGVSVSAEPSTAADPARKAGPVS